MEVFKEPKSAGQQTLGYALSHKSLHYKKILLYNIKLCNKKIVQAKSLRSTRDSSPGPLAIPAAAFNY